MNNKSWRQPLPLSPEESSDAPQLPPASSIEAAYLACALCTDYGVAMPAHVAATLRDLGWVLARAGRRARPPVVICVLNFVDILEAWPGMDNRAANAPTGDAELNAFVTAVYAGLALL